MPHFSALFAADPLLFLSGQLPFGPDGRIIEASMAEQARVCLEAIERTLTTAGLDRTSIVKATVWITRVEDFAAFDAAYAEFFGDHRPARSTVVAQLVVPGALVEIEVIARR